MVRWLVPLVAAVGTIVAGADPSLPDRSAAQLLVDLQNVEGDGLSGTFVESADRGLPAIDARTHVPLRIDVYATNAVRPAVRVAFQQVSFAALDAGEFAFNPPPGTTVDEADIMDLVRQTRSRLAAGPSVVGGGWTSVVTA
jgi:hypothetical protein